MLTMPLDPILGSARNELSRSNIPAALDIYAKLIKKGRFLDEVIHDLARCAVSLPGRSEYMAIARGRVHALEPFAGCSRRVYQSRRITSLKT